MAEYTLKLYLAGSSKHSTDAVVAVKEILEGVLKGNFELEVVDVLKNPEHAVADEVIATPTLLIKTPGPERRTIGRLTESMSVIQALGLDHLIKSKD